MKRFPFASRPSPMASTKHDPPLMFRLHVVVVEVEDGSFVMAGLPEKSGKLVVSAGLLEKLGELVTFPGLSEVNGS